MRQTIEKERIIAPGLWWLAYLRQAPQDVESSPKTPRGPHISSHDANSGAGIPPKNSAVVTASSGNLAQTLDYYPFGAVRTNETATSFSEKRQFIGELYDAEVALSYLNARYYDGARGQFLSQDPVFQGIGVQADPQKLQAYLSDPQNMNSYAYARNNPIINNDPNGQFAITSAILIALAIYSAFDLGFTGGEILNSELLFRDSYSDAQRRSARFNFGISAVTTIAGVKVKTPAEQILLDLGPNALNWLDELRGA